ncbi:hypothetical protein [uncultured Nostoc sp.]|uniref:hypothetical protein n=1 Tax=uncultured Nostoc sp. TaxID=340711 RepID=UPI0035CB490B
MNNQDQNENIPKQPTKEMLLGGLKKELLLEDLTDEEMLMIAGGCSRKSVKGAIVKITLPETIIVELDSQLNKA